MLKAMTGKVSHFVLLDLSVIIQAPFLEKVRFGFRNAGQKLELIPNHGCD